MLEPPWSMVASVGPIPFHAEATFVHGRKMQKSLKTIYTLSFWYSLESSDLLLNEYPYAMVQVISQLFCINLHWPDKPPAVKGLI